MNGRQGIWIRLAVGALVVLGLMVAGYLLGRRWVQQRANLRELQSRQPVFAGDSQDLERTAVVPTLDTPIDPAKNAVWCSSATIAWQQLNDLNGQPVIISGAERVCQRLNTAPQGKRDLPQSAYYAAAGLVRDGIMEQINADMADRFPHWPVTQPDPQAEAVAYACLEAYLKFTEPYLQSEDPLLFRDSDGRQTLVDSFGIWDDEYPEVWKIREQVEVLFTRRDDEGSLAEFAADLDRDSWPFQIVLAAVEPGLSLSETLADLQANMAEWPDDDSDEERLDDLGAMDVVKVPDMFWQIQHSFDELNGPPVQGGRFDGLWLNAAQAVRFRLDRAGVILQSESLMEAASAWAEPRHFVFDRPFLVYMKMRGAEQPFFAMWVANAELLTPFGRNR